VFCFGLSHVLLMHYQHPGDDGVNGAFGTRIKQSLERVAVLSTFFHHSCCNVLFYRLGYRHSLYQRHVSSPHQHVKNCDVSNRLHTPDRTATLTRKRMWRVLTETYIRWCVHTGCVCYSEIIHVICYNN